MTTHTDSGTEMTIFTVANRLHTGQAVRVPADRIAATVSAWLAELEVHGPLVDDLARAMAAGDWPTAYDLADTLAVSLEPHRAA